MEQVEQTQDYWKFKNLSQNRPLKVKHIMRLVQSMKETGFRKEIPILVNRDLEIIDGQHRFEAAKKLGIPFWYQVCDAKADIIVDLNCSQLSWTWEDVLNFYVASGYPEYVKLDSWIKENNITLAIALSWIWKGKSARLVDNLKRGKFVFPSEAYMKRLEFFKDQYHEWVTQVAKALVMHPMFVTGAKFGRSLMLFLQIPELNFDKFLRNSILLAEKIHICATQAQYLQMFRSIYNFQNRKPLGELQTLMKYIPSKPTEKKTYVQTQWLED